MVSPRPVSIRNASSTTLSDNERKDSTLQSVPTQGTVPSPPIAPVYVAPPIAVVPRSAPPPVRADSTIIGQVREDAPRAVVQMVPASPAPRVQTGYPEFGVRVEHGFPAANNPGFPPRTNGPMSGDVPLTPIPLASTAVHGLPPPPPSVTDCCTECRARAPRPEIPTNSQVGPRRPTVPSGPSGFSGCSCGGSPAGKVHRVNRLTTGAVVANNVNYFIDKIGTINYNHFEGHGPPGVHGNADFPRYPGGASGLPVPPSSSSSESSVTEYSNSRVYAWVKDVAGQASAARQESRKRRADDDAEEQKSPRRKTRLDVHSQVGVPGQVQYLKVPGHGPSRRANQRPPMMTSGFGANNGPSLLHRQS
ncbi:hypothetical protein F4804DRAFT_80030 [Jackrogersella minutella]|nr:hypothetical protein F4804DRAFT_80030 [Jackrogersella minutella]